MKFKKWYDFTESIVIDELGSPASLNVVEPNLIREFNYQDDTHFSNFFIAPYQARRIGYVHISSSPTHVGITKTTPIEQGKGTDIAFLKNLTQQLTSARLPPVPYKEGESGWADWIKKASQGTDLGNLPDQFKNAADKDIKGPNIPDIKTGASNMQPVSSTIRVSRASGSWSYFIRTQDARRIVESVLGIMEGAIKPLMDNDLVEWYEIVDRMSGKRLKTNYSKHGEQRKNDWESQWQRRVGYLKFLTENMLKNYSNAKNMVMAKINHVGVKVIGGGENPVQKIQPSNNKVPLNDLYELVNHSYAEDIVLLFFLNAVKTDNDYLYKIMDQAATEQNPQSALYYADMLLNNKTAFMFDHVDVYLGDALQLFKNQDMLRELIPNEFNTFKNEYEEAVNEYLQQQKEIRSQEVKYLKELSKYINIATVGNIDQLHKQVQDQEEETKKRRAEAIERNKFIISEDSAKYVVLGEGDRVWKDVPTKYMTYHGDIDQGEFCLAEIVESEEVFYDAYEKAQEEAMSNAQSRPSETYAEDKDQIDEDINDYGDDFIDQTDEDVSDKMSDEELFNLIKTKYYQEFIKWRIEQLREQEEEDSWKYEPEPDEQDVHKYQEELAVEVAFNKKGLAILLVDEKSNMTVEFHSKFQNQLMPILKRTVEVSTKEKDPEFGEPLLRIHNKIELSYVDKDRNQIMSVQQLLSFQ